MNLNNDTKLLGQNLFSLLFFLSPRAEENGQKYVFIIALEHVIIPVECVAPSRASLSVSQIAEFFATRPTSGLTGGRELMALGVVHSC